ncbi:MAG: winged helix-turn-helix transcriptional regulator [Acidobacteria bacterium]|nr:winged helix-turn-helix transcriptional regulator [Acidobacteriota bacterium]
MMDAAAHALSDPTRRQILQLVRDDESTVGEIASNFPVTRPAISQHLKVLVDAQLMAVRPDGNRRYYRARPEGLTDLRAWLDSFWRTSLRNLKVEVERERWNELKDESQHRGLDDG